MKKVIVLGSTGSLGQQTLEVLKKYREHFEVVGLSAGHNTKLLKRQGEKYGTGNLALDELPNLQQADIVVNVISGIAGIEATLKVLKLGKILLLGNKESLVAEGKNIDCSKIIPLDSEHNAIYEILKSITKGEHGAHSPIKKLILPCSGGPFLKRTDLANITPKEATTHPKWKMGPKISLESATLINKGLEILEAHYLFSIPIKNIEVKIHPECVIHGAVEFENGETIAYFAKPDMREHIENALLRGANLPLPKREIRPLKPNEFTLTDPPLHLPGIQTVLNARDHRKFLEKEETVLKQFLHKKITFPEIFTLLRQK